MGSFPEMYNDPAGIYSLNTLIFRVLSLSNQDQLSDQIETCTGPAFWKWERWGEGGRW